MTIESRDETLRTALPGSGSGQTWGQRGVGQSVYAQSISPTTTVGTRLKLGLRTFHYAHAEGGIATGKMAVYAVDSDKEDTITVEHPIGTTKLTITAESAFVKDQYAEGMMIVWEGTALGDQYVIKSNAAIAQDATGIVTIYEPGLMSAWGSTTDVILRSCPYFGVAISSAVTSTGAGIPLIDITDEYYFWLQTWGPAGVLIKTAANSGAASGEQAMAVNTAGDLYPQIAGMTQVAHTLTVTADAAAGNADFGYVFLTCNP